MPMAAQTFHLNDNNSALVEWQQGKRQEPKLSHDDTDSLVVNLFHHLIDTCHIYLRAIDHTDRNPNATKEHKPWSEPLGTAEQDKHEAQAILTTEHNVGKSTLAEEASKDHTERKKRRRKFAEAVARLLLWGDIISAGKSTTLALVSQGLYHNVVELLHNCGKDLQELRSYLDDNALSETETIESFRALDTWLERTTYMLHDATDVSKGAEPLSQPQISSNSNMSLEVRMSHQLEIIESFEEAVTMLMELSPTIENVLALHVFLEAANGDAAGDFTVTDAAQFWVTRIAESYRSAPENLVQRLGEANWQRYCRLRASKDATIAEEYSQAKSVFHGPTHAEAAKTKSVTPSSIFQDSALGQSIRSTTDYAQSNASHSSFVSCNSVSSHHFHRVPPEPYEVASGRSFVCPLCQIEIYGILNRIQWKMHVFHDLRPYICLADNCPDLLQTFSSRNAWAEHDRVHHQNAFECRSCRSVCPTFAQFEHHMSMSHARLTLEQQHELKSTAARFPVDDVALWSCRLCNAKDLDSPRRFRSHVCQHLEDIALAAVPSELYPDHDADSLVSDEGWGSVSEDVVDDFLVIEPERNIETSSELIESRQKFAQLWPEIQKKVISLKLEYPPAMAKGTPVAEAWRAQARLRYGQAIQQAQMASNKKRELQTAAQTRTQQGSPLTSEEQTGLNSNIQACDQAITETHNFMEKFRTQQESFKKEKEGAENEGKTEITQQQQHQAKQTGENRLLQSLAYSSIHGRLQAIVPPLSGTCQWFLECSQFAQWMDRTEAMEHHGLLWIKGRPGSGKSTLMKFLFEWAKHEWPSQSTISYFFNERPSPNLDNSSLGMYRSLLYQLLSLVPAARSAFAAKFSTKALDSGEQDWTADELRGSLSDIFVNPENPPANIFICALDKGAQEDIWQMVDFLEQLAALALSSGSHLRICLASRHYPHISLRRGLSVVLEEQEGHMRDIETFIKARLHGYQHDSVMSELRNEVCERSGGVFLWVVIVIQRLNIAYEKGEPLTAMRTLLHSLPRDIDALMRH